MGQITSVHSERHRHPLYVREDVSLSRLTVQGREEKVLAQLAVVDSSIVIQSRTPAKFTLNCTNADEFTFLLDFLSSSFFVVEFSRVDIAPLGVVLQVYDGTHQLIHEEDVSVIHPPILDGDAKVHKVSGSVVALHLDEVEMEGKCYISLSQGGDELISFMLYIEKDQVDLGDGTTTTMAEDSLPVDDTPPPLPEDTPEFRNGVVELEQKLSTFSTLLKALIKKAHTMDEATRNVALARSSFSSYLSNLSQLGREVGNDALADLVCDMIPCFTDQSTRDIHESNAIAQHITMPLITVYNSDLKSLPSKHRLYNEQARAQDHEGDLQNFFEASQRTRQFELSRFDYFQYLHECAGGYAVRKLLASFSQYSLKHSTQAAVSKTDNICRAATLDSTYTNYKRELHLLRNALVRKLSETPSPAPKSPSLLTLEPPQDHSDEHTDERDIVPPMTSDIKSTMLAKSGIFYTLGGRGRSGWHKQFICINDNLLSEFVDYKNPSKLRNSPIDITFACVKTLDTLKDRRYCIEVITPLNVKRLFQVNSEEERDSWVVILTKAATLKAGDNQYNQATITSANPSDTMSQLPQANIVSLEINDEAPSTPLALVQDVDPSNRTCCDCQGVSGVEWISLNLLVVVCISCSGVHRSLGSHVSKIRSLTLDDKVFATKEMHELLYHVSNSFVNVYLQSNHKIKPDCSNEERKAFITDKYVNKTFLQPDPTFKANDALIKSVHSANVPLLLKALAYGANTAMIVIKEVRGLRKEVTLFEYSLTHCHGSPGEPVFDVSELLLLNNTPCGTQVLPVLELNKEQKLFWASKIPANVDTTPAHDTERPLPTVRQSHAGRLLMRSQSTMGKPIKKVPEKSSSAELPKAKRMSRFRMFKSGD